MRVQDIPATNYTPTTKQEFGFGDTFSPFKYMKEKKYRDVLKKEKIDSKTEKVLETILGPSLLTKGIGKLLEKRVTVEQKDEAKKKLEELGVKFEKDPKSQTETLIKSVDKLYEKVTEHSNLINAFLGKQDVIKSSFDKGLAKNIALSYKLLELIQSIPTPQFSPEKLKSIAEEDKTVPKTIDMFEQLEKQDKPNRGSILSIHNSMVNNNQIRQDTKKEETVKKITKEEQNISDILESISKRTMDVVKDYLQGINPDREKDIRDIIDQLVKKEARNDIEPDEQEEILKEALIKALRDAGIDGKGGDGSILSALSGLAGMLTAILGRLGLKTAVGAAKGLTTIINKGAQRIGGLVGKQGIKSAIKKIPIIGLAAGAGFGAYKLATGDLIGAGLELASGAASTIPGIGTAASLAIDGAIAARDYKREMIQPAKSNQKVPEIVELNKTNQDLKQKTKSVQQQAPVINNVTNNQIVQNTPISNPSLRFSNNENTFNRLLMQDMDHPSTYSNLNMG